MEVLETKNKYEEWIKENVPQDPQQQWYGCTKYVPLMLETFPELKGKKGVVFSKHNADNYSETNYKEYPHMWCVDDIGNIVDPTVKQFFLILPLEYKEAPEDATVMNRCMNCAKYHYTVENYCSEECCRILESAWK